MAPYYGQVEHNLMENTGLGKFRPFFLCSSCLRRLSQAATCDGQIYDITYGSAHNENRGRLLPLLQDGSDN